MMKFNSIKFEIGVLYTIILGVILLIFSTVLYVTFGALHKEISHELETKALEVDKTIRAYLDVLAPTPDALWIAAQKTVSLQSENPFKIKSRRISKEWLKRSGELEIRNDYVHFVSQEGASIARSGNLSEDILKLFLQDTKLAKDGGETYRKIHSDYANIRLVNYPFPYENEKDYVIQIGIVEQPVTQIMRNWLYSIAISIPLILLLTSFVGRLFAERILNPIREITGAARKITYQDLSLRVETQHFDEEMKNLVEAFNDMIFRLEKSFRHIEEFSSHVAHELKTPLTIIKGEAELALRKERKAEDYQRVVRIGLEESEQMLRTVEDLLLLAKLDYQTQVFDLKPIQFNDFLKEVHEQSKILAKQKNIKVNLDIPPKPVFVLADQLHLKRLFFNIIENAIKYTATGGTVDLKVKPNDSKVLIDISDTGAGIPEEDLPKVFERFYRSDTQEPGTGLGLSIAQSIARIHQGEIQIKSKLKQGTTFTVILPATPSAFISEV